MNASGERSKSLWAAERPNPPPLEEDLHCDCVIVGAGITGLSVAYELVRAGRGVVVVDRGPIGGGMSARTTAHLSDYADDGFRALIDTRGLDVARMWRLSQTEAISRIEHITQALATDCDFRRLDAYLFLAPGNAPSVLDDELVASAQVGLIVRRQDGLPLPGSETTPALVFSNQARFHPGKYLNALADAILDAGGRFFANTVVSSVEENATRVLVSTQNSARIAARAAVVATNAPINDRVTVHTKQAPYRTYAAAFHIPRGAVTDALYWDTADPYHYARLQAGDGDTDILIIGGEDHKTGAANDGAARIRALERWTRAIFPSVGGRVAQWSGQVLEPIDYMAFIGRNPGQKNIYIATGDSGQGMTHGVVAGRVIADLITKGESDFAHVYDPSRKPGTISNFMKENVTALRNFAEYLLPGDKKRHDDLAPGEGAIMRQGLRLTAAFRHEDGSLIQRSATCTHAGCHLRWNGFERCWDCPCHGSHFAPDGEALNGPAVAPLKKAGS